MVFAEIWLLLAAFVPAFLVSWLVTAGMRRWAPALGLIDLPAARKVHTTPTPLGGGIGIWCGVVLPLAAAQLAAWLAAPGRPLAGLATPELAGAIGGVGYRAGPMWAVLAGGTLLSVMGLLDDKRSLPWQPRLAVQFLVAAGLAAGGIRATAFISAPWFGYVVTVLWILVLINSFNFLDNMDGLSAGIALIATLMFAGIMLCLTSEPRWLVGGFLLVFAGSLTGFLCHNRPPAAIFMGDTGSYFIGLNLACMTILGTFYEYGKSPSHVMLAPLCVLAVPLYDITTVILIRLWQRRSPFQPDKYHFSHRLVHLGLSKPAAVLTIYLVTLTTGLGGLLLYRVPDWPSAGLVIALIACILAVVAILEYAGRQGKERT